MEMTNSNYLEQYAVGPVKIIGIGTVFFYPVSKHYGMRYRDNKSSINLMLSFFPFHLYLVM